jgi:site-specific recombinase XerD
MLTIQLSKGDHDGKTRLLASFPYDKNVVQAIREIPGARWSSSKKVWHFHFSESVVAALRRQVRGNAIIDISGLNFGKMPDLAVETSSPFGITAYNNAALQKFQLWMEQKRYSEETVRNYLSHLRVFLSHHQPLEFDKITSMEVEKFNHSEIVGKGRSVSYQRGIIGAIKLFYRVMNVPNIDPEKLERPFGERRLPEVLSKEEVKQIISSVKNLKHRCMLSLIYSAGLRIGEAINMKLTCIDSHRMMIKVVQGKGKKDRMVGLSPKLLELLRAYFVKYRPKEYLFEGQYGGKYSSRSMELVLKSAVKKSGISRKVVMHTLRHSYATHLLESGTDIRYIQELLGHSSPNTTMIYTHVSANKLGAIKSPFDDL